MPVPRVRNPVARALVLHRGGTHQKSKSGQRAKVKNDLKNEALQWKETPSTKKILRPES